ncbi:hypothetical protein CVIRNUC_005594 [Coccomyxa viridis]|uniref:PsbP C-terminal domain-containing protein n=1 Tax=Coccomyxa viridis TaxID=1274662 RepID=A0AAV1I7W5_9CHLO|nr:hypothetical protein CVIRNUC_005594 [Coccomyxa viridis]
MAAMQALSKPFVGQKIECRSARQTQRVRASLVVRASQDQQDAVVRRGVLGGLIGAAALLSSPRDASAAFGDAARVFGSKATNTTGFVPYSGEGFALLLPSKYNPSREKEYPGQTLRYEDNGDAVNNINVMVRTTTKNSIEEYGDPAKFLEDNQYLLGKQVFLGETRSEGGFAANKVSVASLLDVQTAKDKKGKSYYKYEILTRTADGDEGGRHQLISAAVGNGNLYILKVQIGDKRWFKGANAGAKGALDSFVVA